MFRFPWTKTAEDVERLGSTIDAINRTQLLHQKGIESLLADMSRLTRDGAKLAELIDRLVDRVKALEQIAHTHTQKKKG